MRTILKNASIYDSDRQLFVRKNLIIENDIIIGIGNDLPESDSTIIDLSGKYLIPGLVDSHTHSFEGGLYSLSLDLGYVSSIKETLELLDTADREQRVIFGFNYDENNIKEQRFPSLEELDKLFPETPFILRRVDGHSCVINSVAASKISFPYSLPKDFNGLLRKEENDLAAHWFHRNVDNETILRAYKKAEEIAIKNGVVTIHTMLGDAENDYLHFELLQDHLNDFKIEIIPYPQMFNVNKALRVKSSRIGGCILADGSFGSHTAAIYEDYIDEPGNGTLYQTDDFWNNFVGESHKNNLQVGVHCLGDRAVSQIFNAYKKANLKERKDLRHQLIHAELVDDKILSEIAEYNIACVMQPMFDKLWGGKDQYYSKVLGVERALRSNRFKTMINSGIKVVGSSDWYITPLSPLMGIEAAVNHHNPDEGISIPTAIDIYTTNAAWLTHSENITGKIAKGFKANLTVLDNNILVSNNLEKVRSNGIIRDGKWDKAF